MRLMFNWKDRFDSRQRFFYQFAIMGITGKRIDIKLSPITFRQVRLHGHYRLTIEWKLNFRAIDHALSYGHRPYPPDSGPRSGRRRSPCVQRDPPTDPWPVWQLSNSW